MKLEPMSKFLWGDIKYTKLKDYKRRQKSKGLCCLNNLDEPDSCDWSKKTAKIKNKLQENVSQSHYIVIIYWCAVWSQVCPI